MKNIFKTKEAKRRMAAEQVNNNQLPLWKRILGLFKFAFTGVGKKQPVEKDCNCEDCDCG